MAGHLSIAFSPECREIRLWQVVYPSKVVRMGLYHQSMAARAVADDGWIRLQNEALTGKRLTTVLLSIRLPALILTEPVRGSEEP